MKNEEIIEEVLDGVKECLNWKLTDEEISSVTSFLNGEISRIEQEYGNNTVVYPFFRKLKTGNGI